MMFISMHWHEILKSECILHTGLIFILWETNKDELITVIYLLKESLCRTEYEEYLEMENYDKKMGTLPLTALPLLNIPATTWTRRNHYPH